MKEQEEKGRREGGKQNKSKLIKKREGGMSVTRKAGVAS